MSTETDEEYAAWRERAQRVHPGRACFGCRQCDPVPGWSDPEPHGETGWVRTAHLPQEVAG